MGRAAGSVLVAAASACVPGGGEPAEDLSEFTVDSLVSARVVENGTGCIVDADCYLRLQFADTSIYALYGAGERPAPPCEIPQAVSDVAFQVGRGETVDVVVSVCGPEGHYVEHLARRGDAGATRGR